MSSIMGVVSLLAGALIVFFVGKAGVDQAVLSVTADKIQGVGKAMSIQIGRMLEPAQAVLRQVSFDPITTADTLDDRLARSFVLTEELRSNPLVSSVYVGNSKGEFFLARRLDHPETRQLVKPPTDAVYLLQSIERSADGEVIGEFLFYDKDMTLLARREQVGYEFDPRERPWYQSAQQAPATAVMSSPYVFFTTRQIGLSLSRTSRAGDAVIGIDVVLDDLASYLRDLKLTPNTELALIDRQNKVLAYPDVSRFLTPVGESFIFKTVDMMGIPSLQRVLQLPAGDDQVHDIEAGGQSWLGMTVPVNMGMAQDLRLLAVAPYDELTEGVRRMGNRTLLFIAAVVLAFLPIGWWVGNTIGSSLDRLIRRTREIRRFDFETGKDSNTRDRAREVAELSKDMDGMAETIEHFLQISQKLATEKDMQRMLEAVLREVVNATHCAAGAVYLHLDDVMHRNAVVGEACAQLPESFEYEMGRAKRTKDRPLVEGLKQVDLELRDRNGQLQGLLVLAHRGTAAHLDEGFSAFMAKLSGMLAVSIETRQLIDSQKQLLNAVVQLMADAIDAKSPYTGGHCKRVPELALLLADRMNLDTEGPYRAFRMDDAQRYEFYLGAWLHDCGKVTSAEHIVDKASKLEVIYNRIHEIRMRFEVLWRDAEIAHLQRMAVGAEKTGSEAVMRARHAALKDDFAFVAQCNLGGEVLADERIARLHQIAGQSWLRHFDDRLGLAVGELRQLDEARPHAPDLPAREALLADRAEHIVSWGQDRPPVEKGDPANLYGFDMVLPSYKQNMGELHNLSIRRGTLTDEDRFRINDHIVQTYIMLCRLPWPRALSRVPELAATHHEKMDGNGYPRRLDASRLNTFDRIMALADIFEALTAADRPYRPAKRLSDALKIMANMCREGHLDPELFRYFLRSGIWQTFAADHLRPEQLDRVDIAGLEQMLSVA
ncbi:HAMP domain-containing protein [Pigmentiphaga aceris]|uniref:HAMP domain-containing protein n=2 Tax=Pigmentiphaga aceris TaxID=1940612 RepID=A0A5C0B547_9BURK|nr:HAMP domain-containing protein [Pigmentiphaga aceris]